MDPLCLVIFPIPHVQLQEYLLLPLLSTDGQQGKQASGRFSKSSTLFIQIFENKTSQILITLFVIVIFITRLLGH